MRVDRDNEKLSITEIKEGLSRIRETLGASESIAPGFVRLQSAVDLFQKLNEGFLPISYEIDEIRHCFYDVAGAMDLVRLFRSLRDKKKIKLVKQHLHLVCDAGFGVGSTFFHQQSHKSYVQRALEEIGAKMPTDEQLKDASRKSLELMLGLAALNKFESVELEDPNCSGDKVPNPDVIIRDGGNSYGIACKSISSRNFETLRERIAEGLEQIDRAIECGRIDRRKGVLFIDISPLFDHEAVYMPVGGSGWRIEDVQKLISDCLEAQFSELLGVSNGKPDVSDYIGDLFQGVSASPSILVYGHALVIAGTSAGVGPRYLKAMKQYYVGDCSAVATFVERLNRGLHGQ